MEVSPTSFLFPEPNIILTAEAGGSGRQDISFSMIRKMKAWLATIVVLLGSISTSAADFEVDGICYNVTSSTDLTVEVTFDDDYSSIYRYRGHVTIPETVSVSEKTYKVTGIGFQAFAACYDLFSITLPEGLTSIGSAAFAECHSLSSITLPEGLTSIGDVAFFGCFRLTSITLPEGLTSIGDEAFYGCYRLTSITFPEGLTRIGDEAFYACSGLTSISIPESVTAIDSRAFDECSGLTSINVAVGNRVFDSRDNCNAIIVTRNNVLLRGCQNTIIPEDVVGIAKGAFSGCSGLTSITLPEGLLAILSSAFSGCSGLTSISIPESVTAIGSRAFDECSGLTSINVAVGNREFDSRDNCNALIDTRSNVLLRGCQNTIIPEDVVGIAEGAFSGCSGLTSISLPEGVTSIGSDAFRDCTNLCKITCYALEPPTLGTGVFGSIGTNAVLQVPPGSVPLYAAAEGWKDFAILPLDDVHTLEVCLPTGSEDGRYKNMTLELVNVESGQKQKYVISDRVSYTFNGLQRGQSFNVYLRNSMDAVLGEIADVLIGEEDASVSFESVRQSQHIDMAIRTPEGEDVTEQAQIRWFDGEGNYLLQGSKLSGLLAGTSVRYSIRLPQTLGMQYALPADSLYTIREEGNALVCTLLPLEETTITGRVKDAATGSALSGAVVSVSQKLNGLYSKSFTAKTDSKGGFAATVYNAQSTVTVSAPDYLSQSLEFANFNDTAFVGEVALKSISGAVITTSLSYTESVAEGETAEVQDWYADHDNVAYEIYNETQGHAIMQFNVQYPSIVLLEEVAEGDSLRLTASSRTNAFAPVTATATVDAQNRAEAAFNIIGLGGIRASFVSTDNASVVGLLYDGKGQLVKKYGYSNASLSIAGLADGNYTLVTMTDSPLFNSILNMPQFAAAGLKEGADYVKNTVTVISGRIASVANNMIPVLDESKLYYTGNNTNFSVNKTSTVVGNYLTLKGKIDFKNEYAAKVSNVSMVVDLPESCSFVENSVMVGSNIVGYTLDGNRLTIPVERYTDQVRFCIIPTAGGDYAPSAFAQFTIDDKEVLQPIGMVSFEAELMKISVPEITSMPSVVVKGTATLPSEIRIFDNGVLVGTTNSLANGQWSSRIELYKPNGWSSHSIYAEIYSSFNQRYTTEIKRIVYDENYIPLPKISMMYRGTTIVFDQIERKNSTNSYSYVPGYDEFTFTAEFLDADTSAIKNLNFVILASDGTRKKIPGQYNSVKKIWFANAKYSKSNKLPVNVTVDWVHLSSDSIDNSGFVKEDADMLIGYNQDIFDFYSKNDSVIVIQDTDSSFSFKYAESEMENLIWTVSERDYKETLALTDSIQFNYGNDGENWFCYHFASNDDSLKVILVDFSDELAFEIVAKDDCGDLDKTLRKVRRLNIARGVTGVGGFLLDLAGVRDYMTVNTDFQALLDYMNQTSSDHSKKLLEIDRLLNAKCRNGDKRLSSIAEDIFRINLVSIIEEQNDYLNTFERYIEEYRTRLRWNVGLNVASMGVGMGLNALLKGSRLVSRLGNRLLSSMGHGNRWWAYNSQSVAESVVVNAAGVAYCGVEGSTKKIFRPQFSDFTGQQHKIWNWAPAASNAIMQKYIDLGNRIRGAYRSCPEDVEDHEDVEDYADDYYPNPHLTPIIDPSGYVYEGVSSNRLEGVMASCYYKEMVEDMYGDKHERIVLWDAEQYAQENPLFTDEYGMYRWDVPQGLWQVKFEKEGYETTYSDWLPVPPPQLEVNIAMTQNRQPEVEAVRAYEDGIEVDFDKYMQLDGLTIKNIFVTRNGEMAAGTLKLLNEEQAYGDNPVSYASKVRFVPETPFLTTDEVVLTVNHNVKSYAGIQMESDFTQAFDIEKEVESLVVDSIVRVAYSGEKEITVSALPYDAAIGKKLVVTNSSSMIATLSADTLTLDENGQAKLMVNGELPGTAMLTFTLAETDVKALSVVQVVAQEFLTTAAPKASRASGTAVYRGTAVQLTCETKDAVIYYTLDGSCPCDENAPRMVYEYPIIITDDMTIKAMAAVAGQAESGVAEFNFTIKRTNLGMELKEGWNWVSHNMETEMSPAILPQNATRIVGKTAELVNDPVLGLVGNLNTLHPSEAYKIQMPEDSIHVMSGYEFNPAKSISLKQGRNWLGYPVSQTMSLNEAFANAELNEGDYIVGQDGFAQYADDSWTGTLQTMVPGKGYMYHSMRDNSFVYNTALVSKAKSLYRTAGRNRTPWYADKHKYPNIMCLIAEVYDNGQVSEDYSIGAFCGTECRGVGKYVDGKLMMNIYGEGNEKIVFRAVHTGTQETFVLTEELSFKETLIGSLSQPYALHFDEDTGVEEIRSGWNVWVEGNDLYLALNGKPFDTVTLTDANGTVYLSKETVSENEPVGISELPAGVYIVTAFQGKDVYSKKVLKK